MNTETVLCIRRKHMLHQLGFFQGFRDIAPLSVLLSEFTYVEKEAAERTPSFKQIIPYMVFTCYINGVVNFLMFQRAKKAGGEVRLFDQFSIGWLGHINMEQDEGSYYNAVAREMREELGWTFDPPAPVGFINDDTNPVGRVHLGILHHMQLDNPMLPEGEEAAIKNPTWLPWDEVRTWEGLETWSKIAMDYFIVKYGLQ